MMRFAAAALVALSACSKAAPRSTSSPPPRPSLLADAGGSATVSSPEPQVPDDEPYPVWTRRVQLQAGTTTLVQLMTNAAVGEPDEIVDPAWVDFTMYVREVPRPSLYLALGSTVVELPATLTGGWDERVGALVVDMDPVDGRQELLVRRLAPRNTDPTTEALDLYVLGPSGLEHHRLWDGNEIEVTTPAKGGLRIVQLDCDRQRTIEFSRTRNDIVRTVDTTTPRPDAGNCSD